MKKIFWLWLSVFITQATLSQYAVHSISDSLVSNANAVIRKFETEVLLKSENLMEVRKLTAVTVYNKKGLAVLETEVYYDSFNSIKQLEAKLYDKEGALIEKFKKKDFSDFSATGTNLYSDDRYLELNFDVPSFPFTFEMEVSYQNSSTALLPSFNPSPFYDVSTQYASYSLKNPSQIPIKKRAFNLKEFRVLEKESPQELRYEVSHIVAMEREFSSPYFTEFSPYVKLSPERFSLGGKKGHIQNWNDFGNWQNTFILNNRDELPNETLEEVRDLVASLTDEKEKIRAVYEYMQNKTRYISVQVGLGGWQPEKAEKVDAYGYGDCKALTNYTKALLKGIGIESYYTIVNAGSDGQDIDEDFPALQGNHVILTVPLEGETKENLFLECTSQKLPFGFLGTHTDNRKVLAITPSGAEIITTTAYPPNDNLQSLSAEVTFLENFEASASVQQVSEGLMYDFAYEIPDKFKKEPEKYYTQLWGHLNNLDLQDLGYVNDKKTITFEASLHVTFNNYVSAIGQELLLIPNIFNRYPMPPSMDRDRKLPVEIKRGYRFHDQIKITLPEGVKLKSLFDPIHLKSKFGVYTASITKTGDFELLYERELTLLPGFYSKEEYTDYVSFIRQIYKSDHSKIIVAKS